MPADRNHCPDCKNADLISRLSIALEEKRLGEIELKRAIADLIAAKPGTAEWTLAVTQGGRLIFK